jgi:hypothetical protein
MEKTETYNEAATLPLNSTEPIAKFQIRLSKIGLTFNRKVEFFFEILEKIGGLKESIYIIVLIMLKFFQERAFKGSFFK